MQQETSTTPARETFYMKLMALSGRHVGTGGKRLYSHSVQAPKEKVTRDLWYLLPPVLLVLDRVK